MRKRFMIKLIYILLLRSPFKIIKKLIIFLNLIPTNLYEIHGLRGYESEDRLYLREIYIQVKGKRKLHLGHALVAYLNGMIIKATINQHGDTIYGIWTEDFKKITSRYGL